MMKNKGFLLYTFLITIFLAPYFFVLIQTIYAGEKISPHFLQHDLFLLAKNTFFYCGGSALLSLVIGMLMGFLLFRVDFPGKNIGKYLVVAAIAIPSHIQISTWLGLCGRSGILTPYLLQIIPDFSLYNIYGCIWVSGLAYAPLTTILCGIMLHNVDEKIEIESRLCFSPFYTFLFVLFPIIKKNILLLGLCLFFIHFSDVKVTDVLGLQNTLTQKIYLLFNIYYEPEAALYLCIPCFLILIAFILLLRFYKPTISYSSSHKFLYPRGKYKIQFVAFAIIGLFWLSIPVLIYITQSFSKWITVFYAIKREIIHSLYVCICAAVTITSLSLPIAWFIARKQASTYIIVALLWLAFVPGPIAGIATVRAINFLSTLGVIGDFFYMCQDTIFVLIWSLTAKFLPLAVIFMYFTFTQMTNRWEMISYIDGYNYRQVFFRVIIPICRRQIVFCIAIIFIFCMGETIVSTLVIAPGTTTLAIRILTLLHNGARADLSAASLWYLLIVLSAIGLILTNSKLLGRVDV